jgi:SsrA-binding protein
MTKTEEPQERAIATNRKAFFTYEILDRAEAGISLLGTEVKAIREGGLNFRDSSTRPRRDRPA